MGGAAGMGAEFSSPFDVFEQFFGGMGGGMGGFGASGFGRCVSPTGRAVHGRPVSTP
jgi:hypothetical protein